MAPAGACGEAMPLFGTILAELCQIILARPIPSFKHFFNTFLISKLDKNWLSYEAKTICPYLAYAPIDFTT